jgi:hypothetical protein
MKCFHVNQLCCSQHKLLFEQYDIDCHLKSYWVTGNSDKMPFQVMQNDHVVVVYACCHLGPQFEPLFCITLSVVLCVDCSLTLGNAAALMY